MQSLTRTRYLVTFDDDPTVFLAVAHVTVENAEDALAHPGTVRVTMKTELDDLHRVTPRYEGGVVYVDGDVYELGPRRPFGAPGSTIRELFPSYR